ncbi:MAG: hypothetical protein LBK83_11240 [Treponema sp.]|nr:hypothetical protein [Treponema sp.]
MDFSKHQTLLKNYLESRGVVSGADGEITRTMKSNLDPGRGSKQQRSNAFYVNKVFVHEFFKFLW